MSRYGKYEKALNESWASWEPYLIKDATVLDYRFKNAMDCAVADRVPRQIVIEFYAEMFLELIEYVARHRETYEQQARRQLEASRRRERDRLAYIGRPISKTPQKRRQETNYYMSTRRYREFVQNQDIKKGMTNRVSRRDT